MSRRAKLVGCAVIVATSGVALGLTVPTEVSATASYVSPASVGMALGKSEQTSCLYSLIRQKLPWGARFFVTSTNPAKIQALAVVAALWAIPVDYPAQAQFKIDIVPGDCDKVGLSVHPIRARH